jgi:deazaflavin-dependent oxidoreductase (nitroreductase family)
MTVTGFEAALEDRDEIKLTTTGRVTGKPVSCTVWFVRRDGKLYLVPGGGTDSQWYKNLLKTPAIHLAARHAQYGAMATPITDPDMFARVLDYFKAKYGAQNVDELYPHPNVAVEVPLGQPPAPHRDQQARPARQVITVCSFAYAVVSRDVAAAIAASRQDTLTRPAQVSLMRTFCDTGLR